MAVGRGKRIIGAMGEAGEGLGSTLSSMWKGFTNKVGGAKDSAGRATGGLVGGLKGIGIGILDTATDIIEATFKTIGQWGKTRYGQIFMGAAIVVGTWVGITAWWNRRKAKKDLAEMRAINNLQTVTNENAKLEQQLGVAPEPANAPGISYTQSELARRGAPAATVTQR